MTEPQQQLSQTREFKAIDALFKSDSDELAGQFGDNIIIDAPRVGRVEGFASVESLVAKWPALFNTTSGERVRPRFRTIGDDGRAVSEVVAMVKDVDGKDLGLPIAVAGEFDKSGSLSELRIYHYEKALTGSLGSRPSPFKRKPDERPGRDTDLPDVNAAYFRGVSAFDVDAVVSLYEDGAYIEGGTWRIDTRPQIRLIYEHFLKGDPMKLLFSAMTYDGRNLSLEWTAGHLQPGRAAWAFMSAMRMTSLSLCVCMTSSISATSLDSTPISSLYDLCAHQG